MIVDRRTGGRRRGATLAILCISMLGLVGITGLVIDGGLMMAERRHAQAVADSSALAGARDLLDGHTTAVVKASVLHYANAQGYANDITTTIVTVNIPPTTGPNTGDVTKIEVVAQYNLTTAFIQLLTSTSSYPVRGRAVAGVSSLVPDKNSLIALSPHGSAALTITGTGTVTANGGLVQVNSDASNAMTIAGSARGSAGAWNVKGGFSSAIGSFSPSPNTGAATVTDPLASLAPPDTSAMINRGNVAITSGSRSLLPGVYPGGISALGGGALTLQPGIYVIQGGGLQVTGNASLSAPGVTIFNMGGTPSNYGPINLTSQNVTFSPQTSGPYKNLMFYQDRLNTQPATLNDPQSGGLSGTYYFPAARMTFNANGGGIDNFQVIADSITMVTDTSQGNADINIPYDGTRLANVPKIYLVE